MITMGEPSYVMVRPEEEPQYEPDLLLMGWLRTRVNRQGRNVCIALEGEVGSCVNCSIYSIRPGACRKFEAGSPACLLARASELERVL